jgi:hypothetical protein
MNTGKNREKSQGETLKNKSNHTSTRQSNTQDPQGTGTTKGKIQGKVHLHEEVLMIS